MTRIARLAQGAALATGLALAGAAATAQGLIQEVIDRGTLRIGVAEGAPYQYIDPATGEYVGLNIDLAAEVAAIMGVELEIVPASWATLVTGLEVGQYDVIFANLFATPQRALTVSFTDAYDTYGFHVAVMADSPLQSLEDLNSPDVSFAGAAGTVEAQYPTELFPEATVVELVADQSGAGFVALASGQADALMIDPGQMRVMTSQNADMAAQVRLLNGEDALLKPVSLSYAVQHEDIDMLNFLNVFIRDKVSNGAIQPARDAWFDTIAQQ